MDCSTPSPQRVVILSRGGTFCTDLVRCLDRSGVRVAALLLYPPAERGAEGAGQRLRSLARRARALLRRGSLRLRARRVAPAWTTGPLNSARMEEDLRRLEPDWLVLAHCGLVAPAILGIPRGGTLNVHPALLPWIRGNSPMVNSLQRGVALGATAFHVDAGIDTGRIIERRLLPVTGRESYPALRQALHRLWVEMTARLVGAALRGEVPSGTAQTGSFPLCRTQDAPAQRAAAEDRVRRGLAGVLHERWKGANDLQYTPPPQTLDG